MSDSAMMQLGNNLTAATSDSAALTQGKTGETTTGQFPVLVESFLFTGDVKPLPLILPGQVADSGNAMPGILSDDGKALPLAMQSSDVTDIPVTQYFHTQPVEMPAYLLSGMVAVSDGDETAMLQFQADQDDMVISQPGRTDNMTMALRMAQSQAKALPSLSADPLSGMFVDSLAEANPQLQFQAIYAKNILPDYQLFSDRPMLQPITAATGLNPLAGIHSFAAVHSMMNDGMAPSSAIQMSLPLAVSHKNWGDQFNERIQWMVNQNIQRAELKLNPPNMGQIEVRINMNADQAQLHITTASNQIRDIVEDAMPRLREMFDQSGVQLGDVNVSSQSHQHSHGNEPASVERRDYSDNTDDELQPLQQTGTNIRRHDGLLDLYI